MVINVTDMSIQDKLQAMEQLWDSLSRQAPDTLTPAWHGDALEVREQNVGDGSEKILDWDAAKRDIDNHIT